MRNNSIDITGLILQAISLIILLQDYNNKDLMRELQNQDEKYLKKIIEQNDEILLILRERKWLTWNKRLSRKRRQK